MPSYFSNRFQLHQNFLKEKIVNPLMKCDSDFQKRKMVQVIKLDFLYDLTTMKIRIDDLTSLLQEGTYIFDDNEILTLQGIIYYLTNECKLREEGVEELQGRIPFRTKLCEIQKIKYILKNNDNIQMNEKNKQNNLRENHNLSSNNEIDSEIQKSEKKEKNLEKKEDFFFNNERQNFTVEINELNRFISKLEKEIDILKAKNNDLIQRNMDYSEDLAMKHEKNLEIERLKKIIDKNEFENNIKHKNLRDSQIEDLERILSKREDEITWLHKQMQELKFPLDKFQNINKNENENNEVKESYLALIHFLRESIIELIFEIYILSVNQASHRNKNSLIIFEINVSNLKERTMRGILILLLLYQKMKTIMKSFFPNYSKNIISNDDNKDGELFRNQINQWIVENLNELKNQREYDKFIKNKDISLLFKLLSLMYRIKYPMHGKTLKIDLDVKIRLEHKICARFLRVFSHESNE